MSSDIVTMRDTICTLTQDMVVIMRTCWRAANYIIYAVPMVGNSTVTVDTTRFGCHHLLRHRPPRHRPYLLPPRHRPLTLHTRDAHVQAETRSVCGPVDTVSAPVRQCATRLPIVSPSNGIMDQHTRIGQDVKLRLLAPMKSAPTTWILSYTSKCHHLLYLHCLHPPRLHLRCLHHQEDLLFFIGRTLIIPPSTCIVQNLVMEHNKQMAWR